MYNMLKVHLVIKIVYSETKINLNKLIHLKRSISNLFPQLFVSTHLESMLMKYFCFPDSFI
jgi:antibiotic biosynthesis monooxygenase (ABM) superfamily enzyme